MRTVVAITLLFALCFVPFHVTRTVFLLLKGGAGVPCRALAAVSMSYKVTRPLASFNAWLNALLYFLTKDKGGLRCRRGARAMPLRMMGNADERADDKDAAFPRRTVNEVTYSSKRADI